MAQIAIVTEPALAQPIAANARNSPRTNLFVAATLYTAQGSFPARIRNISHSGALIESSIIPSTGLKVALRRGSLEVTGTIVRKAGNKAGVTFDARIRVEDWMPREANKAQQRVDEIVSEFRSERPASPDVLSFIRPGICMGSMAEELLAIRSSLSQLEAQLVADASLVASHPEVQLFDVVLQRVNRLLSTIATGESVRGSNQVLPVDHFVGLRSRN